MKEEMKREREQKKCLQRSATVWLGTANTNKTSRVVSPPPLLLEAAAAASAILSSGTVSESFFFSRYPLTQPSKMGEKTQQKLGDKNPPESCCQHELQSTFNKEPTLHSIL